MFFSYILEILFPILRSVSLEPIHLPHTAIYICTNCRSPKSAVSDSDPDPNTVGHYPRASLIPIPVWLLERGKEVKETLTFVVTSTMRM